MKNVKLQEILKNIKVYLLIYPKSKVKDCLKHSVIEYDLCLSKAAPDLKANMKLYINRFDAIVTNKEYKPTKTPNNVN